MIRIITFIGRFAILVVLGASIARLVTATNEAEMAIGYMGLMFFQLVLIFEAATEVRNSNRALHELLQINFLLVDVVKQLSTEREAKDGKPTQVH